MEKKGSKQDLNEMASFIGRAQLVCLIIKPDLFVPLETQIDVIWKSATACLEELEMDLEVLKPKKKNVKKSDIEMEKRPEKKARLSEFIDDEAEEVDSDQNDDSDGAS